MNDLISQLLSSPDASLPSPTEVASKVQLNSKGRLKHFLTTEGLSKELLTEILDTADSFISTQERSVKKPLAS